jgi:hypothetical protein
MAVLSIAATATTPAHLVTTGGALKGVYVAGVFKGSVNPMVTQGFYVVRDAYRETVLNPDDRDGLWTDEQEALDFLARL